MRKAIIILFFHKKNKKIDIEVPLNITANEFILALNNIYSLGLNVENVAELFLRAENPIILLKGNRTLEEYGMRDGTIINILE